MVAPASASSSSSTKTMSYADRAKRAAPQSQSQSQSNSNPTPAQLKAQTQAQAKASQTQPPSSSNTSTTSSTLNSSVATSVDAPLLSDLLPKAIVGSGPSGAVNGNVWTRRKDQIAPSLSASSSSSSHLNTKPTVNGVSASNGSSSTSTSLPDDDAFVVKVPPRNEGPPAMDDKESWPAVGAASTHGPETSRKVKLVPTPPEAGSSSTSAAHSQSRNHSHSRGQSNSVSHSSTSARISPELAPRRNNGPFPLTSQNSTASTNPSVNASANPSANPSVQSSPRGRRGWDLGAQKEYTSLPPPSAPNVMHAQPAQIHQPPSQMDGPSNAPPRPQSLHPLQIPIHHPQPQSHHPIPQPSYDFAQPYMYWNMGAPVPISGSPTSNPYIQHGYIPPQGYQGPYVPPPIPPHGYMQPSPAYGYGYAPPPPPPAANANIPPPTMLARPAPPEASGALTGYRAVDAVPVVDGSSAPQHNEAARSGNGSGPPQVVFGSIGLEGIRSPSPATAADENSGAAEDAEKENERPFTAFSIGVVPSDKLHLRLRSRTRSGKARARSTPGDAQNAPEADEAAAEEKVEEVPVIDLTDTETKWEFGSTRAAEPPFVPVNAPIPVPIPIPQYFPPPPGPDLAQPHAPGDEWEVKDYGYGFGPVSGTGYAPALVRDERIARERERAREREYRHLERDRDRDERDFAGDARGEGARGRPRRGSFAGGYNDRGGYADRGGFADRGSGYERGGFSGRRARGFNRGFTRGFGRGGPAFHNNSQQQEPPHPRRPSFSVTPPSHFQGLSPSATAPAPDVFSPTGAPQQPLYPPAPPVPIPVSSLSFPLDPTRYWLLGQLEYYLSPQNMAQDFFLRQRMDSRGWIHIPLIASFNRVRSLTLDVQLVRDVLILSSIVQVRYDWVRMGGWEQYVLPDAPRSTVEFVDEPSYQPPIYHAEKQNDVSEGKDVGESEEGEQEEEEEEDVVFVMGR
ncbi:hypothetical protein PLICRDRAFT_51312 [Plicaturopsis crispa FD-325 SS-3]|nr:hypothetical protein PLICRDRAFT_51312 [Plicaturopsis crispa FD-325 SS-3]